MSDELVGQVTQTPEIITGDWTTVNDGFDATKRASGALNALGQSWLVKDANGRLKRIRYVQYNSTANPAAPAAPQLVYWKDNTFQIVTGVLSEGVTGTANDAAGYLVNLAFTNTSFVFIQTAGYLAGAKAPAATAVGDALIGAAGNFTTARVAANTAPTNKVGAWALTAVAANKSDVFVACDSL